MASRNRMMWTGVAIAAALTMSGPSSAFAQAGGAAPAAAPVVVEPARTAEAGKAPAAGAASAVRLTPLQPVRRI
jgi:hypothetical protein